MKSRIFYRLYGLSVASDFPLLAPRISEASPQVSIVKTSPAFFDSLLKKKSFSAKKITYHALADGSHIIQFFDLFLFWVSPDGKWIRPCRLKPSSFKKGFEPALIFLQTNVFSFSLLKMGFETQHSSCVVYKNKALALIGETRYGKSTLAAALLQNNCRLLTDDLLALKIKGKKIMAHSGVPVVKLWPDAQALLGKNFSTQGIRMHPKAQKHVFQADLDRRGPTEAPLSLIYVLWPRLKTKSREIWIKRLKFQDGVLSLIKSSHNLVIQDEKRLKDQLDFLSRLAKKVPVYGLSFPRDRKRVLEVRDRLWAHALRRMHAV